MSTSNIIAQFLIPDIGYFVVFEARDGTRLYGFSETEGDLIDSGTDPQHLDGVRIRSISDVLTLVGHNLSENVLQLVIEALAEFL